MCVVEEVGHIQGLVGGVTDDGRGEMVEADHVRHLVGLGALWGGNKERNRSTIYM